MNDVASFTSPTCQHEQNLCQKMCDLLIAVTGRGPSTDCKADIQTHFAWQDKSQHKAVFGKADKVQKSTQADCETSAKYGHGTGRSEHREPAPKVGLM